MLYDTRWDAKVEQKADPFTLEALVAWLEKQPAEQSYVYDCGGQCMLAQYFITHGYQGVQVSPEKLYYKGGQRLLPPHFNDIAIARGTVFPPRLWPRTFGTALERTHFIMHG